MAQATQAAFDARVGVEDGVARRTRAPPRMDGRPARQSTTISPRSSRTGAPSSSIADCTVFQSFDWLSMWQRHIGAGARCPAVVYGRDAAGKCSCSYSRSRSSTRLLRAAHLARLRALRLQRAAACAEFPGARVDAARFHAAVARNLAGCKAIRVCYDLVHFEKMRALVGAQPNPFLGLASARSQLRLSRRSSAATGKASTLRSVPRRHAGATAPSARSLPSSAR